MLVPSAATATKIPPYFGAQVTLHRVWMFAGQNNRFPLLVSRYKQRSTCWFLVIATLKRFRNLENRFNCLLCQYWATFPSKFLGVTHRNERPHNPSSGRTGTFKALDGVLFLVKQYRPWCTLLDGRVSHPFGDPVKTHGESLAPSP